MFVRFPRLLASFASGKGTSLLVPKECPDFRGLQPLSRVWAAYPRVFIFKPSAAKAAVDYGR